MVHGVLFRGPSKLQTSTCGQCNCSFRLEPSHQMSLERELARNGSKEVDYISACLGLYMKLRPCAGKRGAQQRIQYYYTGIIAGLSQVCLLSSGQDACAAHGSELKNDPQESKILTNAGCSISTAWVEGRIQRCRGGESISRTPTI